MADPNDLIDELDRALDETGEDITLRHVSGTGDAQTFTDVKCRARVLALTLEEIAAGIAQDNQSVIISPTQINDAGWPGAVLQQGSPPFNPDSRIPRINIDQAIIQGRSRTITFVNPLFINGTLVRINMRVSG